MFDNLLINSIIIFFPYLIYIFYISANRRLISREKKLIQFIITIISYLLILKYGMNKRLVLLLLNIPIFFTFINKKFFTYFILIVITILVYYNIHVSPIIIIINYLLLFLLFLLIHKLNIYLLIFMLINSITYYYIFPTYSSMAYIISFVSLLIIFNIVYKLGNDIIGFNKELNELEKEKEVRLSLFKITHEIKNPIAVCKAYLDMYDIDDKKKSKKYIRILKSEIERLLCLLEDFMLVNKSNINCDIMDINLLLEEKVKNVNDLMNVRHINIKYDILDEEIYVMGDYNRLSQVFINLIKNSIEADSNNILLKCYIDNNKVIINIKDDGIGIEKDIMKRIKDPFYTTKLKGTGLGVSLSEEIIKAHNGKLEYSSEYGKGTSVKVMLPLYEI